LRKIVLYNRAVAEDPTGEARFPTTRGSALRGVGSDDGVVRQRAWASLVAAYWKPAYKHVRIKWRAARADAEDAIQGFFERALERDFFAAFDPARGRFRTFFRVCLDRWVSNQEKARTREKRGGHAPSLDFDEAEAEIARAGESSQSPEECFDREFRRHLLTRSVDELRAECERTGKAGWFAWFERYDLADPGERPTYAELARAVGVPETTVTNQLAWVRRSLRERVIAGLEEITATDEELRDEARLVLGPGGG
jgi:RNA polymerase sigma factor (sigma-70 family)